MNDKNQASVADGLRQLADWYEEHQDTKAPFISIHLGYGQPEELVQRLAAMAKAFGTCRKDASEWSFSVVRDFGPIPVNASISRESVCKRIVKWECPKSLLAELSPEAVAAFEDA